MCNYSAKIKEMSYSNKMLDDSRHNIMNTYVNALSMDETLACIDDIILHRIPTQHVVINAAKVNLMEKDIELRNIVNSCPLINADGTSIIWAASKLGIPVKERVTGCDLFQELVKVAYKKKYKIFLFGARENVVLKVKNIYEELYPGIEIVGYRNGYFTNEDEPEMVRQMRESKADIMFVAFSSPQKEFWINKYLKELNIPFVMGVGGSFDIVAGVTKRAPKWFQKHGLEWFYRLIQEPKRMWKRYIIGNIRFISLVSKYRSKK